MAKKGKSQQTEKPHEGAEPEIPEMAWNKFDELMDKALGKEEKSAPKQKGNDKKKAG